MDKQYVVAQETKKDGKVVDVCFLDSEQYPPYHAVALRLTNKPNKMYKASKSEADIMAKMKNYKHPVEGRHFRVMSWDEMLIANKLYNPELNKIKLVNSVKAKDIPDRDIQIGDKLVTPDGNEFVIRWDKVRQAIEIVKTDSAASDTTITINPGVSNSIYIK